MTPRRIDRKWLQGQMKMFDALAKNCEDFEPPVSYEARNIDESAIKALSKQATEFVLEYHESMPDDLKELLTQAIGPQWFHVSLGMSMFAAGFDVGYAAAMAQDTDVETT